MGRLNIQSACRRSVLSSPFQQYLANAGLAAPNDRPEAALDLVNVLVTRRNEVAHGNTSNALAPSELFPYCDQVEAFCRGLAQIMDESLIDHLVTQRGVDHGNPIAVYNHTIACIRTQGVTLEPGHYLAVQRNDSTWYRAKVLGIEIGNAPVQCTPAGQDVAVGLQLDVRCKPTYRLVSGALD